MTKALHRTWGPSDRTRTPPASIREQAEVRAWLEEWAACVRRVDYAAARTLFEDDVVGFGTRTSMMVGLDRLEHEQWRPIWSHSDEFRFDLDALHCTVSQDSGLAVVMVPWTSRGFRTDGSSFHRPGRATIVLRRSGRGEPWRAAHTHLSLIPGTPLETRRRVSRPEYGSAPPTGSGADPEAS